MSPIGLLWFMILISHSSKCWEIPKGRAELLKWGVCSGESPHLRIRIAQFESQLLRPWTNHSNSLSLRFLTYKMGMMIISIITMDTKEILYQQLQHQQYHKTLPQRNGEEWNRSLSLTYPGPTTSASLGRFSLLWFDAQVIYFSFIIKGGKCTARVSPVSHHMGSPSTTPPHHLRRTVFAV